MLIVIYATLILTVVGGQVDTNGTVTSSFDFEDVAVSTVLSRRKRFLIFPDGSSVQLVFCTQNHGYLQIGNIVWFGTTAALAWELPTDPEVFDMFRDQNKPYDAKRRSDVIYYLDEMGKIIDSKEYRNNRRIIINPAFAKRSVDTTKKYKITPKLFVSEMHEQQKNKNVVKDFGGNRIHFYRKEREKLYAKLENFLETLGWNGKECILKMLCQTSKVEKTQGTFIEEIVRAIFTLPKVHVLSELHNQYDDALGANGDCAHLYPKCGHNTII